MISKPLLTLAIGTAILVTSCADNGNGKEEEKVDPTVALADAKKEFRNKKESEFTDFLERLQLAQDEASGVEIMDFVETISTEYDGESVSLNLGDERDVVIIMPAYDQEGFELKKGELASEIGDVLWYCAALARDIGYDLQHIAQGNIAKLNDRAKRGKIGGDGDNR